MADPVSRPAPRLSRPLVALALVAFCAGVVSGGFVYAGRVPERRPPVPGTAAWWPHLVVLVIVLVVGFALRRRAGSLRAVVLAPVGARAADRLRRTAASARTRPAVAARLALACVPMALMLYLCWRVGAQILAGLDPNFTVDAWGGPTYLGAMACHYLDAVALTAAAAGSVALLLEPAGPVRRTRAAD
ncbi:hypothetical protein ACFYTF_18290 [Nocardia thailandica]|uniref:DUF3180 domain-containing protein n=1 Tax=Nocardia thailandica TaxID=257275 RepID=A0ABW6PQU2_9NOCA